MSRYFTRAAIVCTPSQHDSNRLLDDWQVAPGFTVHEDEKETFTGLYDATGQEIHRSERIGLGFGRK